MRYLFHFLTFFLTFGLNAQIEFSATSIDLGNIESAYEIKADLIIKNTGTKNLYLLKADCDRGVKVFTSKKTIPANDTALLVISFIPEGNGKFFKEIKLVNSASNFPTNLSIKGHLQSLKTDDKTACFYFGKPNKIKPIKEEVIVVKEPNTKRDNSNKIPDKPSEPIVTYTSSTLPEKPIQESLETLPVSVYKPNNLLFLIDVSNSMKDSLKLPLLKIAMHKLIDELRDVDRLTIVSYADSVKVLTENINGMDKEKLHKEIDKLKARGLTKGRQAILKSEDILIKNYIEGGNNQMILATDGKFNFYSEDEKKFVSKQEKTPVVMSVIGFGDDRDAIKNLKEIAEKGKGSFLHIKKRSNCEALLMEEIKERSKK
ncbi:MAG: VWA domain-containing protein [Sphingobacteriaceae bacterium]